MVGSVFWKIASSCSRHDRCCVWDMWDLGTKPHCLTSIRPALNWRIPLFTNNDSQMYLKPSSVAYIVSECPDIRTTMLMTSYFRVKGEIWHRQFLSRGNGTGFIWVWYMVRFTRHAGWLYTSAASDPVKEPPDQDTSWEYRELTAALFTTNFQWHHSKSNRKRFEASFMDNRVLPPHCWRRLPGSEGPVCCSQSVSGIKALIQLTLGRDEAIEGDFTEYV